MPKKIIFKSDLVESIEVPKIVLGKDSFGYEKDIANKELAEGQLFFVLEETEDD
jgi:hypothetical protein